MDLTNFRLLLSALVHDVMEPLKEWFNPKFYREIAGLISAAYPAFQAEQFYQTAIKDLEPLTLKERLRRTTEAGHRYLPADFRQAVDILAEVISKINNGFTAMFIPDYVGLYGLDDFDFSMAALKKFTTFASAEFAVREFLKLDFDRALEAMLVWSEDENHHVRRLASEGSRPRLPWSFRLERLIADPRPVRPILENLKADPELYVRKSVANHLNDISKDHPEWMLDWVAGWDQTHPHTAWIVKRATRSLIKAGHPRAFALFGFEAEPKIEVNDLTVSHPSLPLGQALTFSCDLRSVKNTPQKLVLDYKVHYVKKSGRTLPKVFKLKEVELGPREIVTINKVQRFQDLSTRVHYPGVHKIELMINGQAVAEVSFELTVDDG